MFEFCIALAIYIPQVCDCGLLHIHRSCANSLYKVVKKIGWACYPDAYKEIKEYATQVEKDNTKHNYTNSKMINTEESDENSNADEADQLIINERAETEKNIVAESADDESETPTEELTELSKTPEFSTSRSESELSEELLSSNEIDPQQELVYKKEILAMDDLASSIEGSGSEEELESQDEYSIKKEIVIEEEPVAQEGSASEEFESEEESEPIEGVSHEESESSDSLVSEELSIQQEGTVAPQEGSQSTTEEERVSLGGSEPDDDYSNIDEGNTSTETATSEENVGLIEDELVTYLEPEPIENTQTENIMLYEDEEEDEIDAAKVEETSDLGNQYI